MDYMIAIMNYYKCFLGNIETKSKNKKKNRINISGKFNIQNVIVWLIMSIFFIIIGIAQRQEFFIPLIVMYLCTILAVIIKSMLLYKKLEGKPVNINIYQRDLPSNLKPAHVRLLLNDGLIDEISLASTIVDLIDKGFLDIKAQGKEIENKENIFKDRNIRLIKTEKSTEHLLKYEKFLLEWLIDKYGDGKEVTMDNIHNALSNNIYEEQPYELFIEWQGLVLLSFPLKIFYKIKSTGYARFIYLLFIILGLLPAIPCIGQALAIYGLGCLMFASPQCILNKIGVEEIDEWKDLRKYLLDFSNIEDKTMEMVKVWNFYLTYAMVLNINSKSNAEIEKFIGDRIYNKFENRITNTQEKKILERRLKVIKEEEIKEKIEQELAIYDFTKINNGTV